MARQAVTIETANEDDLEVIVAVRRAADERLRAQYGRASWTTSITENAVRRHLKESRVLIARLKGALVGTLRLATKKPWAIDLSYFIQVTRALYLHDMAIAPDFQRKGIGSLLVESAKVTAKALSANAIRLDAYDGASAAGSFYAKCGFRKAGNVKYRNTPLVYYEWLV